MPYVTCPRCGVRTYTAGGLFWTDGCPNCGTRLRTKSDSRFERLDPAVVTCKLEPISRAPAQARRALDSLGPRIGEDSLDHLQLLVSELVTNSIKHGDLGDDSEILVDVFLEDGRVYAEVRDDGVGFTPRAQDVDPLRASGWGLWLLDKLSERWGIESSEGTMAWFEMAVDHG